MIMPDAPNNTGGQPSAVTPVAQVSTPAATPPRVDPAVARKSLFGDHRRINRVPSKAQQPVAPAAPPVAAAAPVDAKAPAAPAIDAKPPEPAKVGDKPPEPAEKPPEAATLTAAEEARRLARINRAAQKLQEERAAFQQSTAQHQQSLARAKALEDHFAGAHREANADPLGFLARTFGINAQAVLDRVIAEGVKPEATRMQESAAAEAAALKAKIDGLEAEIRRGQQESQAQRDAREAHEYKAAAIAPTLADPKYSLTTRVLGARAADEVFSLQLAQFKLTGEALTPAAAADRIEAHFRSQRDLLAGGNVNASESAAAARTEPPKSPGPPTPTRPSFSTSVPKSYKVRAKV